MDNSFSAVAGRVARRSETDDGSECQRYFGKYRGTVIQNIDPLQEGRIQVIVPDVDGLVPGTWAMPCLPSGMQNGFFTVPPIGAGVWVEFEQGDPDYPIWVGGFWGSKAEVPAMATLIPPGIPGVAMQTTGQNGLVINDAPGPTGGLLLKSTTGASISVNDTGIIIQNGKGAIITLQGPSVTINAGALVIT